MKRTTRKRTANRRKAKKLTTDQRLFIAYCKYNGLPKPIPEFQFAKDDGRRWRIDYYFETKERKVALEVEGGVWTNGRHTRGSGFIKDMEKYNALTLKGIYLLRVLPKDLKKLKTIQLIKKALSNAD